MNQINQEEQFKAAVVAAIEERTLANKEAEPFLAGIALAREALSAAHVRNDVAEMAKFQAQCDEITIAGAAALDRLNKAGVAAHDAQRALRDVMRRPPMRGL